MAAQIAAAKGPINTDAYVCIQDLETLNAYIAKAFAARVVAFDTETDALSATHAGLVGVSLAVAPNDAVYVPLSHRPEGGLDLGGSDLKQIPMDQALAALKPLLEAPEVLKVGQNIKYDLSVMARHGIKVAPYDDTMLLSYVVSAGLNGHGMDALSEQYLGHTPIAFKSVVGTGKAQKSFAEVELKPATAYAAEDADVTLRLWQILKPKVASERLLTVYETLERGLPEVLSGMELAGVKIDRARLVKLSQTFGQGMAELEQKAHQVAGQPFNLGSPKQLGEILFEVMAIPGGKKTATGAWSTDVSVLEDLAAKGYELPQILMDWRQMAKLKSTYTDALAEAARPDTDRVHTSYQLAATTTGRLSSSDPNLQNIPVRNEMGRQIRTAFIAEPGHVLVSADYSQIELRLLAHIGDIPQLKRAFAEGLDIHAMTASEMFGVPLSEMTAEIRRRAKAINFGIIYGISAFGLAAQLSIPQGEARDYIALYFKRFPGILDYMEDIKAKVKEDAFVTTLFGRKIHIPDIRAKGAAQRAFAERAAINAPIQGAASDIIRRAMLKIPQAIAPLEAKMLMQVHDELVFEVREDRAEDLIQIIRPIMSNAAAPAVHLTVPLDVEAKAGKTWDEAH